MYSKKNRGRGFELPNNISINEKDPVNVALTGMLLTAVNSNDVAKIATVTQVMESIQTQPTDTPDLNTLIKTLAGAAKNVTPASVDEDSIVEKVVTKLNASGVFQKIEDKGGK